MESKRCQLEQMKEHEAKKEAEWEIESLYHELLLKEVDAKVITKLDQEMILVYYFIWV